MTLIFKSLFATALLFAVNTFSFAAGPESANIVKIGKGATINISETTRMGDLVLKPGTYSIRYRADDNQHYMEVALIAPQGYASYPRSYKRVGDVKCLIGPPARKNQQTAVYSEDLGGVRRATKLEFRGETVAHLL